MPERFQEWYVPRFGSMRFKAIVGMTFYPYTLMVSSLVYFGSIFAIHLHIIRDIYLFITFAICLGISAHSFDSASTKSPGPWGNYIPKTYLMILGFISLVIGLSFSYYYAFYVSPDLLIAGIIEVFFVFSYNLGLFHGYFHNNKFLAFSTGSMPIVSGYLIQSGNNILIVILLMILGYSLLQIQIQASRPYRDLAGGTKVEISTLIKYYERILESMVVFSPVLSIIIITIHFDLTL
jgi:hypothetical protein